SNNRPMPRRHHVERHIRLALDVDGFLPVLWFHPSRRSFVLPLRIELLDEVVFHRRSNIGKSPPDALVVADNDERNSRQRNSGDVEAAASRSQMRFKP